METQEEDEIMETEINEQARTIFGRLNPQELCRQNNKIEYRGRIIILDQTYEIEGYREQGQERPEYPDLARTLEDAREGNPEISGLILEGCSGVDGVIGGFEWYKSHWQPYIAA